MTAVLGRVCGLFLRPGASTQVHGAARTAAKARTAPASIGLLCAPAAAAAAGTMTGLAAARRAGTSCAVVCTWTGATALDRPEAGSGGLAVSTARRLAARLARRGIGARARGRLVRVELPADPGAARALAERVTGAAGETPVVTVVAGTRPEAFDALLAAQDRVVIVPPRGDLEGVGELAVLEAARVARAVGVLDLPAVGVGRLALSSGLVLPPTARRAALSALDRHGE
jgi:hypothetical protein